MTDYQLLTTHTEYTVIRDSDGDQVEPVDIVFRLRDPLLAVTFPEVVPVEEAGLAAAAAALGEELSGTTGVYQTQVTPDTAGTWQFHWQSTTPTTSLYSFFQVPWPGIEMEGS